MRRKIGYLKKTGEKFNIIRYEKEHKGYLIEDMGGTRFFGVKTNEFKKAKTKDYQKKFFPRPLITNPNAYKWKSTEEAEEYFLGSDPRKHKDYKRLSKK